MDTAQSDLKLKVQEVPRSFPAYLGVWIAVIGIVPAKVVVARWLPAAASGSDAWLWGGLLELALLVAGAALTGQVVQLMSTGRCLRFGRICAAALAFDMVFAGGFHWLRGGM